MDKNTEGFIKYQQDRLNGLEGVEFEREEIRSQIIASNKKFENGEGGRIEIYKDGRVLYISESGGRYKCVLRPSFNAYRLLMLLGRFRLGEVVPSDELVKGLKRERAGSESLPERRVRDTIQTIKKKLGIVLEDDPFLVDRGSFGLNCDVVIRK